MLFRCLLWTSLVLLPTLPAWAKDSTVRALPRQVSNFSLGDFRGKEWSLTEFSDKPVIVIAVVGTECPLVQKYLPRLEELSKEYADQGVVFLGVNPNRQDSLAEIGAQVRSAEVTFPMLKDAQQTLVQELGATRTPEVFVLDDKRSVRYRGRIDDQHAVGGHSRKMPVREDLKAAIDEILAGKDVSEPRTDAVGCLITPLATPKADSAVTYSQQVARILQDNCVECHRPGEIAPFSLTDYDEVAGWADMIVEVTSQGRMPPWHASPEHGKFLNERTLTAEERKVLSDRAAGAPQGNPQDLPAPRTFVKGWQLSRDPDYVMNLQDKPFPVPAEGVVRYQYFVVDPKFKEEKWVTEAEVIPGNASVVHHVLAFVAEDETSFDGEAGFLSAYVPGLRRTPFPKGYAKRIPVGAKLIFQVHYTPTGTKQADQSKLGLVFVDPKEVTHEIITLNIINDELNIQPNQDDQRFEASQLTLPMDVEVLTLMPHMHLRGKSFQIDLKWPDGKQEILLDVPNYDFNWQTGYVVEKPLALPRGAILSGWATFDNSKENLSNPDPAQTVHWGEQTWDEMLLAYFDVAVPNTPEGRKAVKQIEEKRTISKLEKMMSRFDKDQNGKIEKNEFPERIRPFFDALDLDKDGGLSLEEFGNGMKMMRAANRRR
ncbi:MAG: redoxin domain-containing protein [Planctomycetaceae bacterium]